MKISTAASLVFSFSLIFISCERHTWDDSAEGKKDGTKRLFEKTEKHEAPHKEGEQENHGAAH